MAAKKSANGGRLIVSDDTYRIAAEKQRAHLRDLADRIERGDPMAGLEPKTVAAVLRRTADDLPKEQPKQRGRQPTLDFGVALEYMALTKHPDQPMTGFRAYEALASKYDVSAEAIRNVVREHRAEAASLFEPDK